MKPIRNSSLSNADYKFDPINTEDTPISALTAAALRDYPGCEHYSEEDAELLAITLNQLAIVFFNLDKRNESHNVDYQLDETITNPQRKAA